MACKRESVEEFLARGGKVQHAEPRKATNFGLQFGKKIADLRRAADPRWKSKKALKREQKKRELRDARKALESEHNTQT